MDELSVFERRLAAALEGYLGPRRPVDALAITRAAALRPPRRWSFASRVAASLLLRRFDLPALPLAARLALVAMAVALAWAAFIIGSGSDPALQPTESATPSTLESAPPSTSPTASPSPSPSPEVAGAPWIVFEYGHDPDPYGALWAVRADGTDPRRIDPGSGAFAGSIAWSPDGTRLVTVGQTIRIAAVGDAIGPFVDTGFGTGSEDACHASVGSFAGSQDSAFSVAPGGKQMAFVRRCTGGRGRYAIAIVDLQTGALRELAATVHDAFFGVLVTPSWSPDGGRIAYTINSTLYIVDVEGGAAREVDLGGLPAEGPQWSPDGGRIAFASDELVGVESRVQNIYTVRPDGTDLRQVTTDGASSVPEWTSTGDIRFRRGARDVFWRMSADGANARPLISVEEAIDDLGMTGRIAYWGVPGDIDRVFFWQPGGDE